MQASWKQSVVYQIYPKSFRSAAGSATGDLTGIIEKLDYLQWLGIDYLWLTPVSASPQRDNGYDISDYYAIDPAYGTMADFERLVTEAHAHSIRIIMDIVVNHTSTDHRWFQESRKSRDNPYRDYYIWRNAPNRWQSKFGGSAWEFDEASGQYYLHLFDRTQADLNWENPQVRHEVFEMMRYWAECGLDGFRLDVINLISKTSGLPDDETDGRSFYTDGPRVHEYLQEMHREVFAGRNLLTVGEMSSTSIEQCICYTHPERHELSMTFSFHHLKVDYPDGEKWALAAPDIGALKAIVSEWQIGMLAGGGWNAVFWCNHDQPRAVSRFGDDVRYHKESAKLLATTLHLMRGTPYVYQGEEIGMTSPGFTQIEDYRDVESINAWNLLREAGVADETVLAILRQKSRDNARTPMQWSDGKHAGFSSSEPWIDIAHNYREINVEAARCDPNSILHHYRMLIGLRHKLDIVADGDYTLLTPGDSPVWAYERRLGDKRLLVVANFSGSESDFEYPKERRWTRLIANYPDSPAEPGAFRLRPWESIAWYSPSNTA